jgi:ech hydrogenase subunit C
MPGFTQSPWIIHYDASSCNGCDIETLACLTPLYDVERLGVLNTGNPKHADIFLVTGAVNEQSSDVIRNIYHQLPEPKVVVAIGACGASGGIFRDCYNIRGGVDSVIPVDVYVPGCAARPEAIIDGVVKALAVLEEKHRDMVATAHSIDQTLYLRANKSDAPEILALQKIAYQSDIEIYGDDSLPALQQSLEDLENDFDRRPNREAGLLGARGTTTSAEAEKDRIVFLSAVVNGKIIGSVRGYLVDDTAHLTRLMVHPYFRRRGIGRRLLTEIEQFFPSAREFEAIVGHKSKRSLFQLEKRGYKVFKTEPFNPILSLVYLRKDRKSDPSDKPAADLPHSS